MTITLPSNTNWLTTIGGLLAGIPALVTGSGLILSPRWMQILGIIGGLGVLLIGLAAKDFNTHSTAGQVSASTTKAVAAMQDRPAK